MNNENKKFKFGFVKVLSNCVLKHENFFTGKVKILSPGLKFVFGKIENKIIKIDNNQFNDLCIDNMYKEKFSFDVSISYQIAGGNNYNTKECKDYYRFLETCYLEEKKLEKEDWLGKYNNKIMYHGESFFKSSFNEFKRKRLKTWWQENHPILQYDKYEKLIINEDNNILENDIHSSLREAFYDISSNELNELSCDSSIYKKVFYQVKKNIMEKGLSLIDLKINNIKVLKSNDSKLDEYHYDLHLVSNDKEKKQDKNKEKFILDYVPLEEKKLKKQDKNDGEFILDYVPLEEKKLKKDDKNDGEFILDYVPLEEKKPKKQDENDGEFIVDYVPLEENTTKNQEIDDLYNRYFDNYNNKNNSQETNDNSFIVSGDINSELDKSLFEAELNYNEIKESIAEVYVDKDGKFILGCELLEENTVKNQEIDDLYNRYFDNYNNKNNSQETNDNSFIVSGDINSELDKSLFEAEINYNEIEESIAEVYVDKDGKFNDISNIDPVEEDFEIDLSLNDDEDELITDELYDELDSDFVLGYLKIDNQIIEVKPILNKDFKIDIPSFVNNNHEKVKVLAK